MQIKHMVSALEVKSLEDNGTFSGYGSVFGVKDSYGEIVVKGAFANSLTKKSANQIKLLWQHRADQPIGVYSEVREDDHGLYVRGQLAIKDVQQAKEAHALLKMGAVSGLSIGFSINENGIKRDKDAILLTDIELWETSIVTFPANNKANVTSVKQIEAIKTIRDFEEFLRDAGFSKQKAKEIASRGFKHSDDRRDADDSELIKSIQQLNQSILGVI
jgi:HK97 family phage prohead protease